MNVANFAYKQYVSNTYKKGNNHSYIDHIIISGYAREAIQDCALLCDDSDNISDHLALTLTLRIETPSPSSQPQKENYDPPPSYPHVQWDDWTLRNIYSERVIHHIQNIPIIKFDTTDLSCAKEQVNSLCRYIFKCLHSAVSDSQPNSTPHNSGKSPSSKTKKAWWSNECKVARDRNRLYFQMWKSAGCRNLQIHL